MYPEQVAELLYANIQAEYPYLAQDDVEVFNEMLDVLRYDSAKDMVSEAEDMRRRREEMYEEYDSDQAMYDATMQERDERVDAENEAYRRELESQESGTLEASGREVESEGGDVRYRKGDGKQEQGRESVLPYETEAIKGDKIERNASSLLDVVKVLYTKGKEYAANMYKRTFFDVASTPSFMKKLGLTGDKFTIKYGVIARHFGKDGSHTLTEKNWEQLPQALQKPFAISKLTDKGNSYRIYTTLQTDGGEYVVVGVDVKNAGREIEVNAISTVFGRRNNANLPKNEEVIYREKEITPGQSSLLERPNFAQYPTEQELSENKDSETFVTGQETAEKVDGEDTRYRRGEDGVQRKR